MKLSARVVAGMAMLAAASINPQHGQHAGLEKRRSLLRVTRANAPATRSKQSQEAAKKAAAAAAAKKAAAAKAAAAKKAAADKKKQPAKAPAPAPAPVAKPPSPAPAPVAPAPGPAVPKSNFSGALSTVQQLQLAAITERAQQTLTAIGMAKFSDADFKAAGYRTVVRPRIAQFLDFNAQYLPKYQAALGANMPGNCTYRFPVGSAQDLVALSKIVEQAGHNARFQPNVVPVLTDLPYDNVGRINYQIKNGVLSNTIAQYIVSCPTALDGGIVLNPPPVLSLPAGAKPTLGQPLALTLPTSVKLDMNHAFVHLVSGDQHIVQNVTLSGQTVTVTLPPQPKPNTKGLTFVSIINNADTGTYSGPSDTNLWTGSVPINAIGEVCPAPFVC